MYGKSLSFVASLGLAIVALPMLAFELLIMPLLSIGDGGTLFRMTTPNSIFETRRAGLA